MFGKVVSNIVPVRGLHYSVKILIEYVGYVIVHTVEYLLFICFWCPKSQNNQFPIASVSQVVYDLSDLNDLYFS